MILKGRAAELRGCAARKNNRKYKIGIKYFQQLYLIIQEEQVNCKQYKLEWLQLMSQ
jgi:hypothetical protein